MTEEEKKTLISLKCQTWVNIFIHRIMQKPQKIRIFKLKVNYLVFLQIM